MYFSEHRFTRYSKLKISNWPKNGHGDPYNQAKLTSNMWLHEELLDLSHAGPCQACACKARPVQQLTRVTQLRARPKLGRVYIGLHAYKATCRHFGITFNSLIFKSRINRFKEREWMLYTSPVHIYDTWRQSHSSTYSTFNSHIYAHWPACTWIAVIVA